MDDPKQNPDSLYRRHEALKRLFGTPELIDTQGLKSKAKDRVATECNWLAQESLRLLDVAYLTGNEAIISTAISLWNMSIDRRRYNRE